MRSAQPSVAFGNENHLHEPVCGRVVIDPVRNRPNQVDDLLGKKVGRRRLAAENMQPRHARRYAPA